MNQLHLAYLASGLLILALGLYSKPLRRTFLAPPLVAMLAGVALGPAGLHLFKTAEWKDPLTLLEEAARVTIVVGLMGVALRLPRGYLGANRRSLAVLLGLVLPLMALAVGGMALALLGGGAIACLLVGAIVAPTDPVVATSIVTGSVAEEELPSRIRLILSAESGANDGLAYPLVMLPIALLLEPAGEAWRHWAVDAILRGVGGAVVVGLLAGLAAGALLRHAERRKTLETHSFLALAMALTLGTLGGARVLGTDGILAVFVAGVAFDNMVGAGERAQEENVQEAISKFFTLPIFLLLGLLIPWDGWRGLGWSGVVFAVGALVLRRLPFLFLLGKGLPYARSRADLAFTGWFGPIGVAALFYGLLARRHTGDDRFWVLASFLVAASVVAHGSTAGPFTLLYGRKAPAPSREE